ncbi:hypothetical protein FRB99_001196 [Tulasnella sp. 403]|nr:hypothetical protein FRB99_001196 [Tulasnella sp. 403]
MITGCFIAFVASIAVSLVAKHRMVYYVCFAFRGIGAGPASCVGLQMLHDISFTHERAQKVGIWTFAMDSGLLMGPIVLGFTGSARTTAPWIIVIGFGLLFLSFLALLPETAFPRRFVQLEEATERAFDIPDPTNVVPTKEHPPFLNLRPMPGLVTPRPWDYILRFFRMFTFPNVTISIIFYAWGWYGTFYFALILLQSMKSSPLLLVSLIISTFLSEVFLSGTLSDAIVKYITRSRKIPRRPEMRLWLMWPAGVLSVLGLFLFAVIQDRTDVTTGLFLTIFIVGVQIGNTATVTYALECHPGHVLDIGVFYSFHINLAALLFAFYLPYWGNDFLNSGGTQVIVTGCSVTLCLGFLQVFGEKVRQKRGPIPWTPIQ